MSIFWAFIDFTGTFLFILSILYVIKHAFFFIRDVILSPVPQPNQHTEREVLLLGLAIAFIITFIIL